MLVYLYTALLIANNSWKYSLKPWSSLQAL